LHVSTPIGREKLSEKTITDSEGVGEASDSEKAAKELMELVSDSVDM